MNSDAVEIWKDIPGYEGRYQASNTGQIKALARKRKNGVMSVERILKQQTWPLGYKKVTLCNDDNCNKTLFVHRLVALAFINNPNNLPFINHKDENPSNNFVDNLEWCTRIYNANYGHRLEKTRGENNKVHKLTEQQVIEIRKAYKRMDRQYGSVALARKYGITHSTILDIVKKEKWKHIEED